MPLLDIISVLGGKKVEVGRGFTDSTEGAKGPNLGNQGMLPGEKAMPGGSLEG